MSSIKSSFQRNIDDCEEYYSKNIFTNSKTTTNKQFKIKPNPQKNVITFSKNNSCNKNPKKEEDVEEKVYYSPSLNLRAISNCKVGCNNKNPAKVDNVNKTRRNLFSKVVINNNSISDDNNEDESKKPSEPENPGSQEPKKEEPQNATFDDLKSELKLDQKNPEVKCDGIRLSSDAFELLGLIPPKEQKDNEEEKN